jgi:hypothetical protein
MTTPRLFLFCICLTGFGTALAGPSTSGSLGPTPEARAARMTFSWMAKCRFRRAGTCACMPGARAMRRTWPCRWRTAPATKLCGSRAGSSYALSHRWTLAATLSHSSNAAFYAHVASFRDPTVTKDLGGTRSFLTLSATL